MNLNSVATDIGDSNIEVNYNEILHYLNIPKCDAESVMPSLLTAVNLLKPVLLPKSRYVSFKIESVSEGLIKAGPFIIKSHDLYKNLGMCEYLTVFAATIGPRVDALIKRYIKIDIGLATILQATGAMFIESYVDRLNNKIKNQFDLKGFNIRPRFSPGYGDLSLDVQKDIFNVLNPQIIGLSLMNKLIMAPEKSVTAFIGSYKK